MAPRPEPQASAPRIPPAQGQMPIDQTEDTTVSRAGAREGRQGARSDTVTHDPRQGPRSGVVVKGRDGKPLSRGKVGTGDPFDIPLDIVPAGWRYQWNVISVVGNAEVARRHNLTMYAQGWRPVPADRHPGLFMPLDYTGPIEIEGMRLEERPEELCAESEAEDFAKAIGQMRDRDEALKGRKANLEGAMRNGFEMNPRANVVRGRKTKVEMSIDEAYDAPSPRYQPADDSQP